MAEKKRISVEILQKFYGRVWTLRETLEGLVVGGCAGSVTPEIFNLPFEILVASDKELPARKFAKVTKGSVLVSQAELIAHVQKTLFALRDTRQDNDWKSVPNIINQGYKIRPTRDRGVEQLALEWPNSAVEELKKPYWDRLLQDVGEDVMLYLLKDCSIFQHVAADCWIQLTGQSVMELKETKNTLKAQSSFSRTPSQIVFVRSRIYYNQDHMTERKRHSASKAASSSKVSRTESAFDRSHILHRLYLSQKRDFILLSKYILPREFKLRNVFTTPTDYNVTTQPLMDYVNRDKEIRAAGSAAVPKRARPFLKTAKYILTRHRKCHYHQALNYFCPIHTERPTNMIETQDLDLSLPSSTLAMTTQNAIGSASRLTGDTDHSLEERLHSTIKPKFAEFVTPARLVSFFVRSVVKYLLPSKILGSDYNFELILTRLDEFVRLRRFESKSLHEVLQGLRIADVSWAASASDRPRRSKSDTDRQHQLVAELVFWIYDGLVMPLLRSNFYITESSAYKNETLYFRRETWLTISKPIIDQLSETIFQRLDKTQLDAYMTHRKLGTSFVRLLPKSSGVRPIINLRRKIAKRGSQLGPSINSVLQPAAAVLNSIRQLGPLALGSSCFGLNDIYQKLKECRPRLNNGEKLYFVKLDIKSCYDSIVQGTLIQVIADLIADDEYLIQKFARLHKIASKVKRRYILRAYDGEADYPNFHRVIEEEASRCRHSIFADSITYTHRSRETILGLIEEHVTRNSIKMGESYYHQSTGIAQGSTLSSMLCSLHFGHMENKHLNYLSGPDSQLMRLIDDFLLITTDKNKAIQFLQHMHAGFPAYGCTIAPDKTLTNFALSIGGYKIPQLYDSSLFPWCGLLIETDGLAVRSEVSRFALSKMGSTLTVESARNAGEAFLTKMKHSIKQKLHRIYVDPELNSLETILGNIFSTMMVVAMKVVSYTRRGLSNAATFTCNQSFLSKAVVSLIEYCLSFLKSQTSAMTAKSLKFGVAAWKQCEVELLSWRAFELVISRKQSRFGGLLALVLNRVKHLEKAYPDVAQRLSAMNLHHLRDLSRQVKY